MAACYDENSNEVSDIWPLVEQLVDAWESDPVVGRYPDLVKRFIETSPSSFAAQQLLPLSSDIAGSMMAPSTFQLDGMPNELLSLGRVVGQQYVDQTMYGSAHACRDSPFFACLTWRKELT